MRRDWEGDIHTLTVHSVTPPEDGDLFDDGELELEFDIEHPPACVRTELEVGVEHWDCAVHYALDDGLAFSLSYSGTPVTEPGTYKIRAWGTTYWTECGDEYDGGVVIIDDGGGDAPAPDIGHISAADAEMVARATGGGIRSAEVSASFADEVESNEATSRATAARRTPAKRWHSRNTSTANPG